MAEEPVTSLEESMKNCRDKLIEYKNIANHLLADLQLFQDRNDISTIHKASQKYSIDKLMSDLHTIHDRIKTIQDHSHIHAETKLDTDVKELKLDKHSKAEENFDVTAEREKTDHILHSPVDADDNGTFNSQGLSLDDLECIKTRDTPGRVKPVDSGFSSVGSSVLQQRGQFNSFAISAVLDNPVQEQDDVQQNTKND